MHVEDEFGAAAPRRRRRPHQEVREGVDVHELHVAQPGMTRNQAAAAPHEGGVLEQVWDEPPAGLAAREADDRQAVLSLDGRRARGPERHHGDAPAGVARRESFASDSGIGGEGRVGEMQDFDRHVHPRSGRTSDRSRAR